MKRPLLPCVTGLALGEAAAIMFGSKGILFPVLLFLLTGLYDKRRQRRQNRFFFCFKRERDSVKYRIRLFLFAGFGLIGSLLFLYAQDTRAPIAGEPLPLEGTIRGKIVYLKRKEEEKYEITLQKAEFVKRTDDENITGEGGENSKKIRGNCQIFLLRHTEEAYMPGDRISCTGKLSALSVPTNPGEFDSEVYNRSRGISCQFFAQTIQIEEKKRGITLEMLSYRTRTAVAAVYDRVLGKEYAALLHAMILGDKEMLEEGQKRRYEENGVAHVLSVSGLHVSVVAGSWFRFLRKRKLSYAAACLGGGVLLIFYGCMTGFGNSVIRAIIMYGVYLGAEYVGVQYDMTSAMSLAGIGMLLASPWRIMEGGWQMSFSAVFAIGYVLPWIKELEQKRKKKETKETARFFRWKDRGKEAILSSLVISAVTMPVVLRVFYTFSPYSVLINLVVIPCMLPVMISGILGGIAGLFLLSSWWGELLTKALFLPSVCILRGFDFFLGWMARLPGAVWTAGFPTIPEMVLLYALEGIVLLIWYKRWWAKGRRCVLLFVCWVLAAPSGETLRILMLDVGQGDAILVQTPGGEAVLIDGGSTSRTQIGKYILTPALRYCGIGKLDYAVVTHMDADHISGVEELLDASYPIRYLLLPAGQKDRDMEKLEKKAENAGTQVVYMERGDAVQFPDVRMQCLHPFINFETEDRNAASLVFHLQYGSFDALFTGDLEKSGEEALCQYLDRIEKRTWEVLKVAHHGSKYSTGQAFLHRVTPAAALVSVGKGNRYGHPHPEVLDRLENAGADLYVTMEKGAILVEVNKTSWGVAPWQKRGSQWKKTRF